MAFYLPYLLTTEEEEIWGFIQSNQHFWACYPLSVKVRDANPFEELWTAHCSVEGLVAENLKKFLERIDYRWDRKSKTQKDWKKIDPPPGAWSINIELTDSLISMLNGDPEELERFAIWQQNICNLIKRTQEEVNTPAGPKTISRFIYPTPEEQKEMVERIYKDSKNGNKIHENHSLKATSIKVI